MVSPHSVRARRVTASARRRVISYYIYSFSLFLAKVVIEKKIRILGACSFGCVWRAGRPGKNNEVFVCARSLYPVVSRVSIKEVT